MHVFSFDKKKDMFLPKGYNKNYQTELPHLKFQNLKELYDRRDIIRKRLRDFILDKPVETNLLELKEIQKKLDIYEKAVSAYMSMLVLLPTYEPGKLSCVEGRDAVIFVLNL
jgi:hypothetical protein